MYACRESIAKQSKFVFAPGIACSQNDPQVTCGGAKDVMKLGVLVMEPLIDGLGPESATVVCSKTILETKGVLLTRESLWLSSIFARPVLLGGFYTLLYCQLQQFLLWVSTFLHTLQRDPAQRPF